MPNGPRAQAGSISSRTAAVRLAALGIAKARVAVSSMLQPAGQRQHQAAAHHGSKRVDGDAVAGMAKPMLRPMVTKKPAIEATVSQPPYEARSAAFSRSTT